MRTHGPGPSHKTPHGRRFAPRKATSIRREGEERNAREQLTLERLITLARDGPPVDPPLPPLRKGGTLWGHERKRSPLTKGGYRGFWAAAVCATQAKTALRSVRFSLLALACLVGLAGCESQSPAPPVGTKEFESAREEYRNIRRQEYGRDSLDPGARAKPLPKAGGR
jgi:hypothetical protein